MKRIYKSKINTWLFVFTAIIVTISVIPMFVLLSTTWLALLVLLPLICFIVLALVGTKYEIEGEYLFIGSKTFKPMKIDIHTIKMISETTDLSSSPALSLDRIKIVYEDNKKIIISPREKHEFINDIQEINPAVIIKCKKK